MTARPIVWQLSDTAIKHTMNHLNELNRRNFIKKTAFTAGAVTFLTRGVGLGSEGSSFPSLSATATASTTAVTSEPTRLKKYTLVVVMWKTEFGWSSDQADAKKYSSAGGLGTTDKPEDPEEPPTGGTESDRHFETVGTNDPTTPKTYSITQFGPGVSQVTQVSTNPNRYIKGWLMTYTVIVTDWE
ncbi:twin-arginine translocation signal domain-containing protein [Luteolibacter pohnpeiensis]|uniref:Twin-arginine translocation signal domain-containing protein n=1 Tax=Luteolibacter pohnpeiensis TaxID=454153 RepID=A0A934SAA3_9BACT|nr:twin-arginine translocation signal domain-containing protein [Luteolibacter pohnpeiensis]MBK1884280.1 twin-arginine translocation signal domain-containing protein [Luteolibacter pohnpeiensis]